MPTEAEYKELILNELNIPAGSALETKFNTAWGMWWLSYQSDTDEMRSLKSKKRACIWLMGQLRNKVDTTIGFDVVKASQMFNHAKELLDITNDEIKALDPSINVPYLESVDAIPNGLDDDEEGGYYKVESARC